MSSRSVALLFVTALALPIFVQAESVVWTTNISTGLRWARGMNGGGVKYATILINPYVSISYSVRVINATTGEIIPRNGFVTQGTPLRYEFVPHLYTDVSWNATGHSFDSPNGDWGDPSVTPPLTCAQKDFYFKYNVQNCNCAWDGGFYKLYSALIVKPPVESLAVSGGVTCGPVDSNGVASCTATGSGPAPGRFSFAGTNGAFYLRAEIYKNSSTIGMSCNYYEALGDNNRPAAPPTGGDLPMSTGNGTAYSLQVPLQPIDYPITVVPADGLPPTGPTLSGGGAASGAGQCTVGTPYTINMLASDPAGEQLRYGIDWDGTGTVEEWVPPGGYISSGTSQTASRVYAVAGSKVIKVLAQNDKGVSSGWVTLMVNCAVSENQSDNSNRGTGTGGSQSLQNTTPSSILKALPSLVRNGDTTSISWSASGVVDNSCKVTSAQDRKANGTGVWAATTQSGITSSPITQQTTYTLTCTGNDNSTLTQSATVNIIPGFREI